MNNELGDDYEPLILQTPTLELLKDGTYGGFLRKSVLEPGIRLILMRDRRNSWWPYIDTKFNPNTGADLPVTSYENIYSWFLGRGTESLILHLEILDSLELTRAEVAEAEHLFPRLISNNVETIMELTRVHRGRCPFLVDRDLQPKSSNGAPAWTDPDITGAGDLFCARALLLGGDSEQQAIGAGMLEQIASKVQQGLFEVEGARVPSQGLSQCMHMLFQAVPRLLVHRPSCAPYRATLFQKCCELMEHVLDRHYDPVTRRFSEFADPETGTRGDVLDPGHCTEFVGLGLAAIYAMEQDGTGLTPERKRLFQRAKLLMPSMLMSAMALGFNAEHEGMVKAVNNHTGEIIDFTMPWWNLPETMRAALFSAFIAEDANIRQNCLAILEKCHNAYFQRYLNHENMLFPYQTRCGRTGKILDIAPSVPEGDPLYHSNLCFLDILKRFEAKRA